jgi:hypothetical protein
MVEVRVEAELGADADEVWTLISDFEGLIVALSGQFGAPLEIEQKGTGVGAVRSITLGGQTIVERLESFDDEARKYSYAILEGPFPVANYVASVALDAITERSCRVAWTGRFEPTGGASETAASAVIRDLYERTMAMLRGRFGVPGATRHDIA